MPKCQLNQNKVVLDNIFRFWFRVKGKELEINDPCKYILLEMYSTKSKGKENYAEIWNAGTVAYFL